MMRQLIVIASAHQQPVVERIRAVLADLVVIWRPRRPLSDLPAIRTLRSGLTAETDGVLMLTPSPGLVDDVACCHDTGTPVLAAGPLPHDSEHRTAPWQFDGQWRQLLTTRRRDAFGRAVFYRRVSGGGAAGLMSTWWALWAGSHEALLALGTQVSSARLDVTRLAPRRSWHASLHLVDTQGSHAQVVVTPQPDAEHVDRLLVGTGGTLSSEAVSAGTILVGNDHIHTPPQIDHAPMWRWASTVLADPSAPASAFNPENLDPEKLDSELRLPFSATELLQGLRRATRQQVTVTLP